MTPPGWRTPFVVLLGGTAILLLSFGLRQNLGLYMAPISTGLGWDREVFAFAVALQSLVWGVSTPFMGWLADRFGPGRVVAAGGAVYAGGLWLMAEASAPDRRDDRRRVHDRVRHEHDQLLHRAGDHQPDRAARQAQHLSRHRERRRLVRPASPGAVRPVSADRERLVGRRC